MTSKVRARLGAMLFLEYFIWGAWYVTVGTWLTFARHFSGQQVAWIAGTTAVGAMIAPFFVGLVTDRFFATERVLAFLHLTGAALLLLASIPTGFLSVYAAFLLYCLSFMPTLALTNSLAFRQMRNPQEEFGPIRILGTAGWIVAGLIMGYYRLEATARPIQIASAVSVLMALYCLTLPHTPPLARNSKWTAAAIFPKEVFSMLRQRSMAVFVFTSFLICIPLQFYYAFTNLFLNEAGVKNAAAKMTGGQFSELFCMLLIPWFFRRLGVKYMLAAGMSAWILRYVLFALGNDGGRMWMLWAGILLHGICYDFFFVTGQIYIDSKAPATLRAAAQSLITFITYGFGMLVGSYVSGVIVDHYTFANGSIQGAHHWQAIWSLAAAASVAALVLLLAAFYERQKTSSYSHPELASVESSAAAL